MFSVQKENLTKKAQDNLIFPATLQKRNKKCLDEFDIEQYKFVSTLHLALTG